MGVDDAVLCQMPEPEVKRHIRRLQIVREALIGFDQHILNDIGRIDAASNRRVEPQIDDPPKWFAELTQEFVDGTRIAVAGIIEQTIGFFAVGPHGEIVVLICGE